MEKQQRRKERELALWDIFSLNFNEDEQPTQEILESFIDEEALKDFKGVKAEYAGSVVEAFKENRDEIDDLIRKYLRGTWTLEEMHRTEKAILELAVTEMKFVGVPVPKEIAINEAVELSKVYGMENSTGYINAILNNIAKNDLENAECNGA